MLERLPEAHMGVEGALRQTRETIYWPGISQQVKDFVQKCDTCPTFAPQQQKEMLQPHAVVEQSCAKVGTDFFTFDGRDYLITGNYHGNFWELDFLNSNTSSHNVINKLRAHFARH